MKKIFIVLLFFMIFTFTIFNNSRTSATYIADEYGTNMTYKTLFLYNIVNPDFDFRGWSENGTITYIFEHKPVEESLEELIRAWQDVAPLFMKVYTNVITFEHLTNTNSIPTNDLGWTVEDGYLYIIIKQDYFPNPELVLPDFGDLAENIKVDTWVITESTPDYQTGYNAGYSIGYQNGYQTGYSNGWNAKEEQINLELPTLLAAEFQEGYSMGYDDGLLVSQGEAYEKGYQDGANESFIGTMDSWLVPAIIIVMLLGGYFAIARKKRDGDI